MSIRVFVNYNGKIITQYDTTYPVSVTYNGSTITTFNADTTKTLPCEGFYAASNIQVGSKTLTCANKRMLTNVVIQTEDNGVDAVISTSGEGSSSNCYITVNGTKYYQTTSFSLVRGTDIVCGVRGYNSSYPGTVTVNGDVVYTNTRNSTQTYTYTLPKGMKNVQFNFINNTYESGKSTYNYCTIQITEEAY